MTGLKATTDVTRRRNRNEKLYKAGARSSVTLAAQNADRRAAVSEIELALSTRCCLSCASEADVRGLRRTARSSHSTCPSTSPEAVDWHIKIPIDFDRVAVVSRPY